jgi:hypothetical protein
MPSFPGPANGTSFVQSNASPIALSKPGDYCYVLGQLAASATQLPLADNNVAFEAAPAGATEASIAVELPGADNAGPPMVSIEVLYSGVPGAGESIQIQEADTHADAFFITPSNANYTINAFNANNVARVDLSPTGGKFMRVLRTKGANAVGGTVKITRLA